MNLSKLYLLLVIVLLFSLFPARSSEIQSITANQSVETPTKINIDGNQDLISQARRYGWDNGGLWDGSENYPFRIQNLYLTFNGIDTPISIFGTSLHLYLQNVTVDGMDNLQMGMLIYYSHHITIFRSSVINLADTGQLIQIFESSNIRVISNEFVASDTVRNRGIQSISSNFTMIYSNSITGYDFPLELNGSNRSVISDNTISQSDYDGIWLEKSEYVSIKNNIFNSTSTGIHVISGNLNFIQSNTINNSIGSGITTDGGTRNLRIFHNMINNSGSHGMAFEDTSNNMISMNVIRNSFDFGIYFSPNAISNTIKWNSFLFNQASNIEDNGNNNLINYNHYNGFIGNDANGDNYEDASYLTTGSTANFDPFPLSLMHDTIHQTITNPTRISTFTQTGIISWDPFYSNYLSDAYYNVFYRKYLDSQWIVITTNLYDTTLNWDVSGLDDGKYQIRVTVVVNGSVSTSDSSREFFVRNNHLSPTRLFRPNGGENIQGEFEIRWLHAFDLNSDPIQYQVSLSFDNGLSWEIIGSNIFANYLLFDFSSVRYGEDYRVKVVAEDGFGYFVEDISDSTFTAGQYPSSSDPSISSSDPSISSSGSSPPISSSNPKPSDNVDSSTEPALPIPFFQFSILLIGLIPMIYIRRK